MAAVRQRVRYIVLTSARTGSNHLISLLRQHLSVQAYYELLHNNLTERSSWRGGVTYDESEPVAEFLKRVFDSYYHPLTRAVGFKLFYSQAQPEPLAGAWDELARMPDLRVIELVRENRFRQFVSFEAALRSQRWLEKKGAKDGSVAAEASALEISAEKFIEFARQQEQDRNRALEYVGAKPRLELSYESLDANRNQVLRQAFTFLSVPAFPHLYCIRNAFRKQGLSPLANRVSNYAELKAHFSSSEYARYFDE